MFPFLEFLCFELTAWLEAIPLVSIGFDNFQVLEKQLLTYILAVPEGVSWRADLPAFLE